jgi:hypothetical protein
LLMPALWLLPAGCCLLPACCLLLADCSSLRAAARLPRDRLRISSLSSIAAASNPKPETLSRMCCCSWVIEFPTREKFSLLASESFSFRGMLRLRSGEHIALQPTRVVKCAHTRAPHRGTRAHNLRIRSPTPCPLGQGGFRRVRLVPSPSDRSAWTCAA